MEQNELLADPYKLGSSYQIPRIGNEHIASLDLPPTGIREFSGKLKTGEAVRFIPINKDHTKTDKRLSIYKNLSGTASIQKLFGVYSTDQSMYAVMEELESDGSPFLRLDKALTSSVSKLSRTRKILLCQEIASVVWYLHSLNYVVKIISDKCIFVRERNDTLVPVFTNLEFARSVYAY